MTDISFLLNQNNPPFLAKTIAANFKKLRLQKNITQQALSQQSGVALSTLKRFEQEAEVSLRTLLQLAVVLNATEAFANLFSVSEATTMDEFLKQNSQKTRKRARE